MRATTVLPSCSAVACPAASRTDHTTPAVAASPSCARIGSKISVGKAQLFPRSTIAAAARRRPAALSVPRAASTTTAGLSQEYESPILPTLRPTKANGEIYPGVWSFSQEYWALGEKSPPEWLAARNANVNMAVVRMESGKLACINPIGPTDELMAMVQEIGEVDYVVITSSNGEHTFTAGDFMARVPSAKLFAPPFAEGGKGFPKGLEHEVLSFDVPEELAADFDIALAEYPMTEEDEAALAEALAAGETERLPHHFAEASLFFKGAKVPFFSDTVITYTKEFAPTRISQLFGKLLAGLELDTPCNAFTKKTEAKHPAAVAKWCERVSSWDFEHYMSAHFTPTFPLTPAGFKEIYPGGKK